MRNERADQHLDLQGVVQGSHEVVTHETVTLCMSVKTLPYQTGVIQQFASLVDAEEQESGGKRPG